MKLGKLDQVCIHCASRNICYSIIDLLQRRKVPVHDLGILKVSLISLNLNHRTCHQRPTLGTIFVSSTSGITKVCNVQSDTSVGKIEEAS